jgi:hypothetical protein
MAGQNLWTYQFLSELMVIPRLESMGKDPMEPEFFENSKRIQLN